MSDSVFSRFKDLVGGAPKGSPQEDASHPAAQAPLPDGGARVRKPDGAAGERPPVNRQPPKEGSFEATPQQQAADNARARKAPEKPADEKRARGPMAAAVAPNATDKKIPAPEGEPGDAHIAEEQEAPIIFDGNLLTAIGSNIKIPQESRNLCALFDTGLWLVSASHRNSPLVTSVAATARRMGFQVGPARLVTPDVI
ncbi:MAG: hypothetical protein K2Q32_05100, partial [Alphaproteobacteria bacterium]|nr:hypothetical protein [Alphaproteobacteria bacterium]